MFGEFRHALAAVEFLDRSDDGFALRLGLGKSHGIRKVAVGNIHGGLHDSILRILVFQIEEIENTASQRSGLAVDERGSQPPKDVLRNRRNMAESSIIRYMPAKQPAMYPPQRRLLEALGERLRLARLRRQLSIELTCQRAGIARMTLYRAEAGNSAVALGTLVRILSVLGLAADLEVIARDDKLGRQLQDQALRPRSVGRTKSSRTPGAAVTKP
jgi:transcriptional regulator with XRE-family HTH domain